MADTPITDEAQAAIRSAAALLTPHASDGRVAGLIGKLGAMADSAEDEDGADLVKAMISMETLRKSEDFVGFPVDLRKRCDDASRAMQREYLAGVRGREIPDAQAERAAHRARNGY